MICDLCNSAIVDKPACVLGTKDVVTSKDCWAIYLKGLIADKVLSLHTIHESLSGLVAQMASSDTPWALCENCKQSLNKSDLFLELSSTDVPSQGHALCKQSEFMRFEFLDDGEMQNAFRAATAAAQEITSKN